MNISINFLRCKSKRQILVLFS
uniref:Uncharacterized protein n=1 Tax=Rhizophora mucronata TaxID=61149 RepID=A0A2P2QDJ1_RHIMU